MEYKFKAYIKSIGQMVQVLSIDFENEIIKHEAIDYDMKMDKEIPMRNTSPFRDCNIMIYTNLKDINDKEIYEGDIVLCKVANSYRNEYGKLIIKDVFFNKDELRFEVMQFLPLTWGGFLSIEVIGNIYSDSNYIMQ